MIRTLEYDDAPRDLGFFIEACERLREKSPGFKATCFAIPSMMKDKHWQLLENRADWIRVGMHGHEHERKECRENWGKAVKALDDYGKDPRWAKIYKAPFYGYAPEFLMELADRGFVSCLSSLGHNMPYPCPRMRVWWHRGRFNKLFHPEPRSWRELKMKPTELTEITLEKYLKGVKEEDRWAFIDELAEEMPTKINLGCGSQDWPGWLCLDRSTGWGPNVQYWEWPQRIPVTANRADVVFMSHLFEYIQDSDYAKLLLEVWRVLRPCAVVRIADLDNHIWRAVGSTNTRGTGTIRSAPSREKIVNALWEVGFQVYPGYPGRTLSPHQDVIRGDNRERLYNKGRKFYVEAFKAVSIPDLRRGRWYDIRARRGNRYELVDLKKETAHTLMRLLDGSEEAAAKKRARRKALKARIKQEIVERRRGKRKLRRKRSED